MTRTHKIAADLHSHVPPDWYEQSVRINFLQRYWHHRRIAEVIRFSETVSGPVLDIGSADGYFTSHLLRPTGSDHIHGIDVLKSSVAYANSRYRSDSRLSFSVGDAHKLKYPNNYFSAVYCLEALEHVCDHRRVLSEIYRVLSPGGYTIILVPSENMLFRLGWPVWTKWRGKIWQDTHLNSFNGDKLPQFLSAANFVDITRHKFIANMLLLVKARKPKNLSAGL